MGLTEMRRALGGSGFDLRSGRATRHPAALFKEVRMAQYRYSPKLLLVTLGVMAAMALAAPLAARSALDTDGVYTSRQEIGKAQAVLVQEGELASGSFQVGVLDDATAEALRTFQSRHGLKRTGVVDYETMALLESHFLPGDADGDWVTDALDRCPDTPRGATVDTQGCPSDADQDGVYDGLDHCADTPAGTQVDQRGCPVLVRSTSMFQENGKLVLEGVHFETNSAKLTEDSQSTLDHVAFSLKDWSEVKVE